MSAHKWEILVETRNKGGPGSLKTSGGAWGRALETFGPRFPALLCLYFLWSPAALAAVSRPPLPVGLDVTVEAPQVYTAEVALLGAEEGDDGSLRLRLRLSGGEAAVEVSEVCRFLDGRKEISPAGFIGLYKGKKIVIDFLEVRKGSYLIVECRGAAAQRR